MIYIYRASAGSGKTYTLAYQYLKMLLGRQGEETGHYTLETRRRRRHRSILAITFTNKATDEMKRRIIHELAVLAGAEPGWTKPSPYIDMLCRDLRSTPDRIAAEARRALSELLFDYGSFSVSTIDAFFQQVLRAFAREADLTGNYEVDLDDEGLIRLAVAQLFRSIDYPSDPAAARRTSAWLSRFIHSLILSGHKIEILNRDSTLFNELVKFSRKALGETFAAHSDEMTAYLADPDRLPAFVKAMTDRLTAAETRMTSLCTALIPRLEAEPRFNKTALKFFAKFRSARTAGKPDTGSATLRKAIEEPEKLLKAGKGPVDFGLLDSLGELGRAITEWADVAVMASVVGNNIYFLGLLADILREMAALRRENNMLLLSDTNGILNKIIGDDDTPFLYERMGVRLEHFLIDEFQDTSRMQWANLRPLIAEGLATDRDSLIIGDEKQCIYRFRSSDPSLLRRGVRADFPATDDADTAGPSTNWRSSATMIDFNNRFFTLASKRPGCEEVYTNVVQGISPAHSAHTGYIDIAAAEGRASEVRAEGYRRMADAIERQIKEGGYRPADIAVVTRKKSHAADAISYLLERQRSDPSFPRFRIISDDSIRVGSSRAVKLVISALRAILLRRPSASGAAAIEAGRRANHTLDDEVLARFINDYEFFSRSEAPSAALARAVDAACGADDAHAPGVDTEMLCPNLQTLVDRVIATLLTPDIIADEHIFIAAMQDCVASFMARGGSDLRAFLQWWDKKGADTAVAAPEADDTLRVMTIHKSKGLEFRCVHIPVTDWKIIDFKDAEWFETAPAMFPDIDPAVIPPLIPVKPSSSLESTPLGEQYCRRVEESELDELNTLYVAFTRAIDELVVTYNAKSAGTMSCVIADVVAAMGADTDGALVTGEPTVASAWAGKGGSREALEPRGVMEIAPAVPTDTPELWRRTRLDSRRDDPLSGPGRGIMLHDVLSRVGVASDLPRAVRRLVAEGVVPAQQAAEVEELLRRELSRDIVRPWFEGFERILTERTLASGDGSTLAEGHKRPDRVVWTADGHIDIIDYKSGEERPASHRRQVADYMRRFAAMGYTRLRGFIWYLDAGEIIKV